MLIEQGHQVTAAKRMTSDPRPLDSLALEAVDVNLNDSSEVSLHLKESDLVIHSAAMIQIGWSKLEASRKVNVEATRTLAQAARRRGIRMIHVSTVDTLADLGDQPVNETQTEPPKPLCTYVVSKREASEAFAAEVDQGLDGVTILPGFMVGPWDWRPSSGEMMRTRQGRGEIYFGRREPKVSRPLAAHGGRHAATGAEIPIAGLAGGNSGPIR